MFLAWVKLTILQIFCCVFGFTVPGPYGRHWLVLERLLSVVGEMQTFCSGCFCTRMSCCDPIAPSLCLMPVHLTLWKAISGGQCSKNLTQIKRFFFYGFIELWLPRGGSGRAAEPRCCGERAGRCEVEGEDHPYCCTISDGQMSVAGLKLQCWGYGCTLGGLNRHNLVSPWQPLPTSASFSVQASTNAYAALR